MHITMGTNKEKKLSLDIYQLTNQDYLEKLQNKFKEGKFSSKPTSKKKFVLIKILRKNRPAFFIREEALGNIRCNEIELNLDLEEPYPRMLKRPQYSASLETMGDIEKLVNELLDMEASEKLDIMRFLMYPHLS
ncbi:hypothetical protein O181_013603 [Austropuccinia psidii MF-1]|uniref:Uncharacterized protein n=1 Tax=Austropuccinia psidii MF-1 TaxID=1389203 RepID=A0A9Q3GN96_9BASI|nr:hypothetical protein [Austropuccinia psidii MF-1]